MVCTDMPSDSRMQHQRAKDLLQLTEWMSAVGQGDKEILVSPATSVSGGASRFVGYSVVKYHAQFHVSGFAGLHVKILRLLACQPPPPLMVECD